MKRLHRPRFLVLVLLPAVVFLLPQPADAPARGAEPDAPSSVEQPVAVYHPTGPDPSTLPGQRFDTELSTAYDEFRVRLAELTAAHGAASDPELRLLLERRISALKTRYEIRILEIQFELASDLGRAEDAAAMAARLEIVTERLAGDALPAAAGEGGDGHED